MWYGLASKPALQRLEAGGLQPLDRELPGGHPIRERFIEPRPFPLHVQRLKVARAGDHHQHANRRFDGDRLDPLRQIHVADERRVDRQRDEAIDGAVVQELPRDVDHARIAQAQADAKAGVLAAGLVDAAAEARLDVAAEDGVEQGGAERLRGVHLLRFDAAGLTPRPPEPEQEVLELVVGEGQAEFGRRLARW